MKKIKTKLETSGETVRVVDLEGITYRKSMSFMPAVVIFCLALFTNVKALQYANVETVIVFRWKLTVVFEYCEAKETYSRI